MPLIYSPGKTSTAITFKTGAKKERFIFILRPELIVTETETECDSPSSIRG